MAILPAVPDGFRFTLEGMTMNNIPSFRSYGNYKSDNYGAHALVFSLESKRVYFSYQTPVAFWTPATGLVCRQNDWGPTTGKHLNAIQPDKSKRVSGDVFERMMQEHI